MDELMFPFLADDLNPGERLFAGKCHDAGLDGVQLAAEDIAAARRTSNGKWRFVKAGGNSTKNEDHVVYGKPFYAMADGVVVGAWRNAPDNPKPEVRHPALTDKLMVGGGNHLWIRHADGSHALYAHAQPGSIPPALCPHESALFSQPHNGPTGNPDIADEVKIPVGSQPTVKKGQFLGRVGNSGSSDGPHLHVHLESGGKPALMVFERGLATSWDGGNAGLDSWESFGGNTLPHDDILIWPVRRLGQEITRHRLPMSAYQRIFLHLAESGYMPKWIDAYRVRSDVFANFVWVPSSGVWQARHGMTANTFKQALADAEDDGLALTFVESHLTKQGVRYIAKFTAGGGPFRISIGLDFDAHKAELKKATELGLSPANISVVSVGGERRYTVLYRTIDIGSFVVKSRLSSTAYQDAVKSNRDAGRFPVYLAAYLHKNAVNYSAVFASKPTGKFKAHHGLTASEFQEEFELAHGAGMHTTVVTAIDGAKSKHRFAGVWRK